MNSRLAWSVRYLLTCAAVAPIAGCGGSGGGSGGGTATWASSAAGLEGGNTLCVAFDGGATWYAGTDSQGVYRSVDGGTTWIAISNGLPDAVIRPT